ncbi:HAD-IC family P-type ATPase [Patescibacteria group bacterium]|jgi:Ca2+-transporting ATPase|nr:HAD-IC family P-type ATPase [Patescibacteria group bacterium]
MNPISTPWSHASADVLKELGSQTDGLSTKEAKTRFKKDGPNRLPERGRATAVELILKQIKSPLIAILLVAAAISFALFEYVNTGVLLATVFVNVALGFWQENKAETVLAALKNYTKTRARVHRDGAEHDVDADELVVGDVIRLSNGSRVPADARLIEATGLQIDESMLTGESLPIYKATEPIAEDTHVAERTNMVFGGTLVVQGLATAVITATSGHTEFGRIAALAATEERETTPLQRSVAVFAKQATIGLLLLCAVLFVIGLNSGRDPREMFFITVAVAVSAVPEGLPIALTVILASGVERLARRRGVVRKLLAAETLGSTSLILTDKTGTLTQAKMSLTDVHPVKQEDGASERVLRHALLATDVTVENPKDRPEQWKLLGKSMEASLARDALMRGQSLLELQAKYPLIERLPFNSEQKYGGTVVKSQDGPRITLLGAPDILIKFCTLSEQERKELLAAIEERTNTGERLLGVVTKDAPPDQLKDTNGFTFEGWLAFRDPLRPSVADAIRRIAESGVKTSMVTGDHPGTATWIARSLGLINGKGQVMTGTEIDHLDDVALLKRLPDTRVFARTTPEQKLRLVRLSQALGEVVAVTGDGVNDAPALKAADVGVAVGSGTDVAKAASDLVILDDDYGTIVHAVEEGRRILDNIRKALSYLLSNAFAELVLIGGSIIFGLPIPLTAIQILYVNFFSDSFPAVAYAFEQITDSDKKQPRHAGHLLDRRSRFIIFVIGTLSSLSLFGIYLYLLSLGIEQRLVHSFVFAAFGTYTLFVSLSLRSLRKPLWSYGLFGNKPLAIGVLIGLGLMIAAIYLPWLNDILGTKPLEWPWVLGVIGFGLANVTAVEIAKRIFKNME